MRRSIMKIQISMQKMSLSSRMLTLILTFYFGTVLNLSFWRYIFEHLEITNPRTFLFAATLPFFVMVPIYVIFSAIIVPKIAKPLLVLILLVSSAANYMMYALGVYIDSDMIQNVFETNQREAFDLITFSGLTWFFLTGVIPSIFIVLTRIEYRTLKKEVAFRFFAVLGCVLLMAGMIAISYKEYASFGRNNKQVPRLMNPTNYIYATVRYFQRKALANRQFVVLDPHAKLVPFEDPHPTVLILIVGETARAQNFSLLGYHRKTNPKLEKQDITVFREVESCGTSTAVSVPCMFSHMDRKDFNADDAAYTENLMDILQKSGYDVLWLENDDGCKGVCKRIPNEQLIEINNPKYCDGRYCLDEVLIDGLENRLKNIRKDTVIVLHTMGSHGPTYYRRYPEAFKVFKPTCDTADIQSCSRESVINTYDNTILYTDHIVSSAIDILKKFPNYESGLFYIADHGESLGENNIYLHGLPFSIAPKEQTTIPMILWMSKTMEKWDYVDLACLRKEAATRSYTHDFLFDSILGLLEIKTTAYDKNLDLFKNCRTKELPH